MKLQTIIAHQSEDYFEFKTLKTSTKKMIIKHAPLNLHTSTFNFLRISEIIYVKVKKRRSADGQI